MLPLAPTRFSTTTGWPRVCPSLSASTRAAMSGAPPGGIGTMIVTGRDGNCADASVAEKSRARKAGARNFMRPSLTPGGRNKRNEKWRPPKLGRYSHRIACETPRERLFEGERVSGEPAQLELLMALGVFAGAVVSGFTGFAFSAVAGAVLLHALPPSEAVPLMMICSVLVQSVCLVSLRRHIQWRGSLMLVAGGVFGLPPALYVLLHADPTSFRIGFGLFLSAYAGLMLF